MDSKYLAYFLLALIILLGSAMRLYGLEIQSLRSDELLSWELARYDNVLDVINPYNKWYHTHPPAYEIFLYYWTNYVGDTEYLLRLPSAIAGILAIPAIYLMGARLYTEKEGLIAAALMAVLWFPIYHSQDVRPYTMLLLTTLAATYFWFELLCTYEKEKKPSGKHATAYVIFAVASAYLHYFGLYLVLLQGVGTCLSHLHDRKALRHAAKVYGLILAAFLPWAGIFWGHLSDAAKSAHWIPKPDPNAFIEYLLWLFNFSDRLLNFLMILFAIFIATRILSLWKAEKNNKLKFRLTSPTFMLLLWLIVPFTGVYVKSVLGSSILIFYTLIISLPAAYLLVARSIAQLPTQTIFKALVTLLILEFCIENLICWMPYYTRVEKTQFRQAANYIIGHDNEYPDSLVLGCNYGPEEINQYQGKFNYYFKQRGSSLRADTIVCTENDINKTIKALASKGTNYVWYISGEREPEKGFLDFLTGNMTLIDNRTFYRSGVWLFRR